jgi:hypothetical protein
MWYLNSQVKKKQIKGHISIDLPNFKYKIMVHIERTIEVHETHIFRTCQDQVVKVNGKCHTWKWMLKPIVTKKKLRTTLWTLLDYVYNS